MGKRFAYNEVDISNVKNVELVSDSHQGWKDFKYSKFSKEELSESEKDRLQNIRQHQSKFQSFKNDVEKFVDSPEIIKDKVQEFVDHLRQAEFNDEGFNKNRNVQYSTPASYDKKDKITQLGWNNMYSKYGDGKLYMEKDSLPAIKEKLREEGYDIVDSEKYLPSTEFGIPQTYWNNGRDHRIDRIKYGLKDLKEGSRNEVLRFLWHKHLVDVEDFIYQRAEAYLRDMDSKAAKKSNMKDIQKAAKDFEDNVVNWFEHNDYPIKDSVFKIVTDDGDTLYKEMDLHTEHLDEELIVEIYKSKGRSRKSKEKQIKNYIELLQRCTTKPVKGLLLTSSKTDCSVLSTDMILSKSFNTDEGGFEKLVIREGVL